MKHFLVALFLVVALAACQSAPQIAAPSAHQESGAPQTAPVAQERAVSVTINMTGSGTISGQASSRVSSDGDVRSAESQRTGTTASGAQTSTPTQTTSVDPAAVAKAATDLLATVDPTSEAAGLAVGAIKAAKDGDGAKATDLLAKASKASTTPAVK